MPDIAKVLTGLLGHALDVGRQLLSPAPLTEWDADLADPWEPFLSPEFG